MAARRGKSKKRSYGKELNRPLKSFTLYLDENVDFDEVADALKKAGVRYRRHRDSFGRQAGISDEVVLQYIGPKRWVLLTTDQRQRSKHIERVQILKYKIRQFVFTSGNLSKSALVEALMTARHKMRKICTSDRGPFSASISKSGEITFRLFHRIDK
jgi:hypothetical protein